jgi:cell division protein FtsN
MQAPNKNIGPTDRKLDSRAVALGVIGFLVLIVVFFLLGLFCLGPMLNSHVTPQSEATYEAPISMPPSMPKEAPTTETPQAPPGLNIEITEHGAEDGVQHDENGITATLEPNKSKPEDSSANRPDSTGSEESPPPSPPADVSIYRVQAGTFVSKTNADNLAAGLREKGFKPEIQTVQSGDKTLYRVQIGEYDSRDEAQKVADELIASGQSPIIYTETKQN